ncbi:MAG TPA: hypothetical protein GX528_10180 [Firmicutes bacterium]|nr:hypothetical protein [Bacillota bacterium]
MGKPLFEDLERVKLNILKTCEKLLQENRLEKDEFQGIVEFLDGINEYSDQEFKAELSRLSKGLSDFLDWE